MGRKGIRSNGIRYITISRENIDPVVSTQLQEDTGLEEHLQEALETAENNETKYHIRSALQTLYIENH